MEIMWKYYEKNGGQFMAIVILWKFCSKFYGTSDSEVPHTERIMGIMNTWSLQ